MAASYNNLGLAYKNKGVYDRAIEYYEKSLRIKIAALGDEHPSVATSYNNLGSAYDSKGEYDRAIEYFSKAVVIGRAALGSGHPDSKRYVRNLERVRAPL